MTKHPGRFSLLALVLFLFVSAVPAHAASYPDLPASHWAYEDMDRAAGLGILSGVGGGRMAPADPLTWGQYLAMLTRTFAPEDYDGAVAQGLAWDRAGYQAACDSGLLTEDDFLPVDGDDLSGRICRQDVAVLLDRALPEEVDGYYLYSWSPSAEEELPDWGSLDPLYRSAVSRLFGLGIIKGKSDGSFGGGDPLQRCDGTVFLIRALNQVDGVRFYEDKSVTLHFVDQNGAALGSDVTVESYVGQWLSSLADEYAPAHYTSSGSCGTVSSAAERYTVPLRAMTQTEIQEADFWDKVERGEASYEDYYRQDFLLKYQGENPRKYLLLFGNENQRRFTSRSEAEAHMTTVTVPVWKLSGGSKVSSTMSLSVHAALAEDVKAIFTEIYNDPERFPIHDVGGYSWRGDSATGEHNCGTAIDINSNENYQVRDGAAMAGSLWNPGSNPYSIPAGGSVVRIFAEHGWSWGGNAWAYSTDPSQGYHDYMHFSYMGG